MKKLSIILVILFVSMLFVAPAHSQVKKLAQTGLQFLKVDMSPRAASMGAAFTEVTGDASAMFYNPAGIAEIESNVDVFGGQTQWIADITYNAAGAVKSFGKWGVFGVSMIFADYGDIEGTEIAANEAGFVTTGNVDVSAYAVGLSYGKKLSDNFSIGGTVRFLGQKLGESLRENGKTEENSVSGTSFDFGTVFYPGYKSFRFGMSVRNFSDEFEYEEDNFQLPLTFTFGVAMNVLDLMEGMNPEQHQLLLAVDAIHPRDFSERIHMGGEYWFQQMFALRAGYKTNYDIEGLTAGVGFKYNVSGFGVRIDYAYSDIEFFDAVNRFSVGLTF